MTHRIVQGLASALLSFFAMNAIAQAPAPPAVPADVSPLYVVTYVEAKSSARDETAALLKSYRDASRKTPGNLRSIAVQRPRRPGQFVVVAAWKDKAAWDAHMAAPATREFREKLNAMRAAPPDDRFHNALSVGPMEDASGAVYGVTHVDVIPPQSQRCPSKWGAGDGLGSGNHVKNPKNVLRAAQLSKKGEVIELSHVLGP